jgi:CRP/FNR family cyclic AMP-dependent transcriptional regulator
MVSLRGRLAIEDRMHLRLESRGTNFDKRAVLRDHPIFGALGPELIERLASYARVGIVPAGTTIFARGDTGASLFAVCAGTVKIINRSLEGKDAVFNLINVGEIFGEIALLDGRPRTADALAMTDCELMMIDRREFVPLVESQPDVALRLIEVFCARLRHTSEQIEDVLFLDFPARLAKTLLWLAKSVASSPQGKVRITQREIGQIIGMSRESTNKQLRIWAQRKWLRLERGGIVVLAPGPLGEIANGGLAGD